MAGDIPLPLTFTVGRAGMQSTKLFTMFCLGSQERLYRHFCDGEVKISKYLHSCLELPLKDTSQTNHKIISL